MGGAKVRQGKAGVRKIWHGTHLFAVVFVDFFPEKLAH